MNVFDIECADWTTFVCGAYLDHTGYHEHWHEWDFATMMLTRQGVYYAHSGGRYDALWLLDQASKRGMRWSATMAGSRVLSARIGNLEIRDSAALMPDPLKAIAPMGGNAKLETGLVCDCGDKCGGYCRLGRLTDAEKRRVSEYLEMDCRALQATLESLHARCEEHTISLGQTVGGSAWKTAKEWLGLPKATHSLATYEALSEGRYGARCEVYRQRGDSGHRHDIHASYPAALTRVALPVGTPRAVAGTTASRALSRGDAGIFWCDVRVPERIVAPLPVRVGPRLVYPVGRVSGAWCSVALEYAMRHGAVIERVTSAYIWPETDRVLAPFAKEVWALRAKYARSSDAGDLAYSAWLKWLANSLTGKLSQSPIHETLRFLPNGTMMRPGTPVLCETEHGSYIAEESCRPVVDACAHVEWYTWLVADAAGVQLDALCDSRDPWYGDTDSRYSGDKMEHTGDALGDWGYEGAAFDWHARAPKIYSYRCGGCKKHPNGGIHVRGKGLSGLTEQGISALDRGEAWRVNRGVDTLKTRVRSGDSSLWSRRDSERSLKPVPGWVGARIIDGASTRAPTLAEFAARPKAAKKQPKSALADCA